jgi:hypothetical protein
MEHALDATSIAGGDVQSCNAVTIWHTSLDFPQFIHPVFDFTLRFTHRLTQPTNDFIPGWEPPTADHSFVDDKSRHNQDRRVLAYLNGIIDFGNGHLLLRMEQLEFLLGRYHHPANSIAFGVTQTEDFDGDHNDASS